jgi:hydrogenase 3 maturation protease
MPRPPRSQQRQPQPSIPSLPDELLRAERVAVLGVGSELRGDDVAGVLVARKLQAWCARRGCHRLAAFVGTSAPENLTGEIARFRPDWVVMVDAAHLGREPGAVEIVTREKIGGLSFSTHMLPAPIVLDYLEKTTGCRSLVVGIQLEQTEVLADPSTSVVEAVGRLVRVFQRAFGRPADSGAS